MDIEYILRVDQHDTSIQYKFSIHSFSVLRELLNVRQTIRIGPPKLHRDHLETKGKEGEEGEEGEEGLC